MSPRQQFIDANGNYLYVTTVGISGTVQPVLPANSWAQITSSSVTSAVATFIANNNFTTSQNVSVQFTTNAGGTLNFYNVPITAASSTQFSVAATGLPNAVSQNETSATAALCVTDNTIVWTVAQPNGIAFRLGPLPASSGIVWKIQPVVQLSPTRLTNLKQTFAPIPDEYGYLIRQGIVTFLHEISDSGKFAEKHELWLEAMQTALRGADRERDDKTMYPSESLAGGNEWGNAIGTGAANPYGYGWGPGF
jgi:hypothetical protein